MWFSVQPNPLWIKRTTWNDLCARVISVGEAKAPAFYYGNPEVLADIDTVQGFLKQRGSFICAAGPYKTWRQHRPKGRCRRHPRYARMRPASRASRA